MQNLDVLFSIRRWSETGESAYLFPTAAEAETQRSLWMAALKDRYDDGEPKLVERSRESDGSGGDYVNEHIADPLTPSEVKEHAIGSLCYQEWEAATHGENIRWGDLPQS